jgi:hypothetical protein
VDSQLNNQRFIRVAGSSKREKSTLRLNEFFPMRCASLANDAGRGIFDFAVRNRFASSLRTFAVSPHLYKCER